MLWPPLSPRSPLRAQVGLNLTETQGPWPEKIWDLPLRNLSLAGRGRSEET